MSKRSCGYPADPIDPMLLPFREFFDTPPEAPLRDGHDQRGVLRAD
ncbi:hypothetical protein [Pseudodesulfovibrio senegalensis]|nr:hypothetical protein [Pseudodesulfovibrio senegalensis]